MSSFNELFTQSENHEVNLIDQPITYSIEGLVTAVGTLNDKIAKMDTNTTAVLERLITEIVALRKEDSNLRSSVQPALVDTVLPKSPFKEKQLFLEFEKDLHGSSEKQQKRPVSLFHHQVKLSELQNVNISNVDKYIRTCWRKFMTDEVAEHFSWKGTSVKQSAIGLATTAGIRSAFRHKFNLDEDVFKTISKKYFQYAYDRQKKLAAYRDKKNT